MKHIDAQKHVTGRSLYVDDVPQREGTLHAVLLGSSEAHGKLRAIHLDQALQAQGVVAILTAKDIPGENQIGGIFPDEPLLADGEVHYRAQPIAIIVADSEHHARLARDLIKLDIEPLRPVTSPREAYAIGEVIGRVRTFQIGDPSVVWEQCTHLFSGKGSCGGQEHLYIETQGAYAYPTETGHLRVLSSTQGPTAVQRTASRVLALPMHSIEVDVLRLGGGFGGKEDQATPWAVMAALAALKLHRPVKLILHRLDDMAMTGKRHPYEFDYKIGLDPDLRILAYEVFLYQDAGASADLSPAVLERSLFHFTNSYFVPNARATAASCRTNTTSHTAFRGFGGPQGMFAIETAIAHAAEALSLPAYRIQAANLLREGDTFPYGQTAQDVRAHDAWKTLEQRIDIGRLSEQIEAFNQSHPFQKKGLALMPICFGISFTKKTLNQAGALVHVYQDGSVSISTGAVEMGQGVSTKMIQVASHTLGIHADRVRIEATNTSRIANTSPSAASATADLNGKALAQACERVHQRLIGVAAVMLGCDASALKLQQGRICRDGQAVELSFDQIALEAYNQRVSLSEYAHYATPGLSFDTTLEKGHPFAYHVYGCAALIATVDCLRGIYSFDRVHVIHDFGDCMNRDVDLGQAEGGIVQGIGWMTMEELRFNEQGRLLSNALSTYKVPDIFAVPEQLRVESLDLAGSPYAIFKSKAVGEPPLMYGIGAYFAIRNAIRAFQPQPVAFSAPMTHEKVLMALYPTPS